MCPEGPPGGEVEEFLEDHPERMRVARHARTVEYPPGERFASMDDVGRRRVAVATILHLPEREAGKSRYGVNVEALRCVAVVIRRALDTVAGLEGVDFVIVHDGLPDDWITFLERHGITLVRKDLPAGAISTYGSEFCAATMLKAHLHGLTQYDRVLYIDLDMLPTGDMSHFFTYRYPEGLVGYTIGNAPIAGNIFVVGENTHMDRVLKMKM